jgi:soluble lytic murein transglycosylase-like protein
LKFEFLYPFFAGVVAAVLVCFFAFIPRYWPGTEFYGKKAATAGTGDAVGETGSGAPAAAWAFTESAPDLIPEQVSKSESAIPAAAHLFTERDSGGDDPILAAYRDSDLREAVVDFFGEIVRSGDLAAVILSNADAFNVSPSLAFALCWEESRFNARAINRKNVNKSIDRGLFQLNNGSFPKLLEEEFFDPNTNARHGIAHLRWCIDIGGSVIAGLAMYNAGTNRVRAGGTPKKTLDYISQILTNQAKIEELFAAHSMMMRKTAVSVEPPVVEEAPDVVKPRLVLLSPVRGRL